MSLMSLLFAKSLSCFWLVWGMHYSLDGYLRGACTGGRQICALQQEGRDWSLLARSKLQFLSFAYARGVGQVCYLGRRQGCHQVDKRLSFPSSTLHETLVFQYHHRYSETTSTSRCTAETVVVFFSPWKLIEDKFYEIDDEFWQVAQDKSKKNARNQLYPISSSCARMAILVEAKVHVCEGI